MEVPSLQFWSACVKTGAVTHMSTGSEEDVLNVRMACLGEAPQKDSRTVLFCAAQNKEKSPVCILREGRFENQTLDLKFPGSTKVSFSLGGTNPSSVHLSGFIEPLLDMPDQDQAFEMESEESQQPAAVEELAKVGSKRAASHPSGDEEPPKKKIKETHVEAEEEKKSEEDVVVVEGASADEQSQVSNISQNSTPSSQKKKSKKKKKRKKFTFDDQGVGIKTSKKGSGPGAEKGDYVRIRYIGQLEDDEIFDKNLGEGFDLTLGQGGVIKGWELGLQGIRLNEKRKIIVPSELGYGAEGDEKIPPNSELWFTCECLELNKGGQN